MFRCSHLLRSSRRCWYDVLGVTRTASAEEIKVAFRERAKKTHPDATGSNTAEASGAFRDMVDAYRVLRDPTKRAEYDREAENSARRAQYGPSGAPPGYDPSREGPKGDAEFNPAGIRAEWAAVSVVVLAGFGFIFTRGGGNDRSNYIDPDPYPQRRPSTKPIITRSTTEGNIKKTQAISDEGTGANIAGGSALSSASGVVAGTKKTSRVEPADELVKAYYNPFADKWHRIPEGYEPPGSMDLTAWHKRNTDPLEWSRMFAEGKLSEMIPRGGLRVRYLPVWNTHEPLLVRDPDTGRTLQASAKLPSRKATKQTSEVEF